MKMIIRILAFLLIMFSSHAFASEWVCDEDKADGGCSGFNNTPPPPVVRDHRTNNQISGKLNPKKCLHKKSPGWKNGNPIHVWDCGAGGPENKSWVYDSKTGYIRGKLNRNKCLHKKSPGWKNGNPIHVWDCGAGGPENKSWVYDSKTGYIRGKLNRNKCLHKKYPGWKNGNPIHVWDCDAGGPENKSWKIL